MVAQIAKPSYLAVTSAGDVYLSEGCRIRRIYATTGIINTVAGTGVCGTSPDGAPALATQFNQTGGVAVDKRGNLYIADGGDNAVGNDALRIRMVGASSGLVSTMYANPSGVGRLGALSVDDAGDLVVNGRTFIAVIVVPGGGSVAPYFLSSVLSEIRDSLYPASLDAAGNLYVASVNYGFGQSTITLFKYADNYGAATKIRADFDGDGKAELVLYRPSTGTWLVANSTSLYVTNPQPVTWGNASDTPVLGDYDGDGKLDYAVYRSSTGAWYLINSATNTRAGYTWGAVGDIPVPGDYDGDGKTDLAVYRPTTGEWYVLKSSTNFQVGAGYKWGAVGDIPVPGDYDGDGRTDLAVFRPTTGEWFFLKSSTEYASGMGYQWGASGDTPVPGDFDGDGTTDLAVYRPSTGEWYFLKSSTGFTSGMGYSWGTAGDVPIQSDFDGDGITDLAVFRPSTQEWYFLKSSTNFTVGAGYKWGSPGDLAVVVK